MKTFVLEGAARKAAALSARENSEAPSRPVTGRGARQMKSLLSKRASMAVALALAAVSSPGYAQEEFNILANDYDRQFAPTITFTNNASDRLVTVREGSTISVQTAPNPARLSALVVANLVQFPFSEISEEMPVNVSVGGFQFSGKLGEDVERRRLRNGTVAPFDARKRTALFFLTTPVTGANGVPRAKTVGSVRFSWNLRALAVRVAVEDAEKAGTAGIYDKAALVTAAALDSTKGGLSRFRNEPVMVKVGFGSAAGERWGYGTGRVESRLRAFGPGATGTGKVLTLSSIAAVGKADLEPPRVGLNFPTGDQNYDQKISFNGIATDLPPGTLTGAASPFTLRLFIDDVEKSALGDAPDFSMSATGIDPAGSSTFTISELGVPTDDGQTHTVRIEVLDASGNVRQVERPIAVKRPGN